jgi:hypothetical protein
MPIDPNLESRLAGLSPEARLRVENALKEALAKEGALAAAGFDRGPFDRSGYDRSTKELAQDISTTPAFPAKEQGPAR